LKQIAVIKKCALLIFVLFLNAEIVNACSQISGSPTEDTLSDKMFFFSSIALVLAVIIFYFLKKRTGILIVVSAILSFLILDNFPK